MQVFRRHPGEKIIERVNGRGERLDHHAAAVDAQLDSLADLEARLLHDGRGYAHGCGAAPFFDLICIFETYARGGASSMPIAHPVQKLSHFRNGAAFFAAPP
jgi:hypothetical protein